MARHGKSSGFTLVELLVVIAIIALLIAILLGPLMKVRRRAAVLATPIVTADGSGAIELLHPHAAVRIDLAPRGTLCWNSRDQGPHWSPRGTWIGHTIHHDGSNGSSWHELGVVNAATGEVRRFTSVFNTADRFPGWADDDHFIEVGDYGSTVVLRDAQNGAVTRRISNVQWRGDGQHISPLPPGVIAGAVYVAGSTIGNGNARDIVALTKDFSIRKLIYTDPSAGDNPTPRVDPFGEFIAWSAGDEHICVKSLKSPSSVKPDMLPGTFCDWTEDGKILAKRNGQLVILSREGRLINPIPAYAAPFYYYGTASWRKYTHQ